jgi:serine/threonine-protein kinase
MEKKPEVKVIEPTPEKIEMVGAASEQSPGESQPRLSPPAAEVDKSSRSHTTPNIGGGSNDTDGRNKTKLKPLDEGTVLNGRYEIIRKIGGGGMGAVYLASDKNLGGVLRAVKEMVQSYIEDEQQDKAISDFKRESLLLTSLEHQSIPTIYDYFFDEREARFYLVMKYISGGDLAGRLRAASESRIDEREVTQWAIQIADVLEYLHNRQPPIVYRDLKPANIMVDSNSGRVMLIDFGIARWVNKEEKGVTAVGTMGYAPPELFSGNVEARSDIYSLGSTMFHLVTGADPQSNPLLIFDFQKHPRPRQINPKLSDQMERILMRSVEYSADKRFTSAAEFKRTLEEHLENLKQNRVTFGVKEAPSPLALSDQPVFCGFCGQKIVATDMFCAFCGAKQPLAQQGVHAHSEGYAPALRTAQLLIIGTNELEQPAFRLEKDENLVGRRDPMSNIFPEVDLSKFDPQTKISRRHARIWREGGEFMVEDLGSSNGTYILPVVSETMRLQPHQPQLLTNGDKLKLGDTTLHFVIG